MSVKELLKKQYDDLVARKEAIDKANAPLIKKREALWEKIHALRAEIDVLSIEVKATQGDEYRLLCSEIGSLAVKLGGRSVHDVARNAS